MVKTPDNFRLKVRGLHATDDKLQSRFSVSGSWSIIQYSVLQILWCLLTRAQWINGHACSTSKRLSTISQPVLHQHGGDLMPAVGRRFLLNWTDLRKSCVMSVFIAYPSALFRRVFVIRIFIIAVRVFGIRYYFRKASFWWSFNGVVLNFNNRILNICIKGAACPIILYFRHRYCKIR